MSTVVHDLHEQELDVEPVGERTSSFANARDGVKLRVNRSASSGTGPDQSDQGFQEES